MVLALAYTLSCLDRQILVLLIAPSRQDLQLDDTHIGLLTGPAFAIVYAVAGVPLGMLVDRLHRLRLVAAGIALWTLMTIACAFARDFETLFALRMGVGLGEAVLTPAAYSLLADRFGPARLGRPIAVYTVASHAGMALALLLGASLLWLVGAYRISLPGVAHAWQAVFIVSGALGLLPLGLLAFLREPMRAAATFDRAEPVQDRVLLGLMFAGYAFAGLAAAALAAWAPELLRRSYGLAPETAGLALGLLLLVAGVPALLLGGVLMDHGLSRGRPGTPMLMSAIAFALLVPLALALPFPSGPGQALALIGGCVALLSLPSAVAPAALQLVTPPGRRGAVSALYLLCTSLVGMGGGPLLVGLLTDGFTAGSIEPLARALGASIATGGALAAILLALARDRYAAVLRGAN